MNSIGFRAGHRPGWLAGMAVWSVMAVGVAQAPAWPQASAKVEPTAQQPLVKLAPIPAAAQFDSNGHLDVDRATRAYLDTIPTDKREASDKYFQGGYWLLLWDALFTAAVMLLLLFTGLSVKMRGWAERMTRFKWLQAWIYFAEFSVVTTVVGFPVELLRGFLPRAYL